MKRITTQVMIIHGTWCLVASAAFALGYHRESSTSGQASGFAETQSMRPLVQVTPGASNSNIRPASVDVETDLSNTPSLSEQEIDALGEKMRNSSNPIEKRLAFSKLLGALTKENALQIREQIAHRPHHSAEFREFHYAWGTLAGKEALMFGIDTEEDDMSPVLAGWASAHPSAARAWFESLDPENDPRFDPLLKDRKMSGEDLRGHLMGALVHGLADADPDAAVEFLHRTMTASGDERAGGLMDGVVEAVIRSGSPSEASQWAEALPEGRLRGEAMERVADRLVEVDPVAAATWAEKLTNEPEGANVVAQVGANWAWRDPQAALNWLQNLPEGASQSAAMGRAFETWARRDPTAASEHLTEMPPSPATDAAIGGFSRRVAWENPQAAVAWAETISSEPERLEALADVGRAWAHRDAPGAAEWLVSSGLPEDIQQEIINAPSRHGDD